MNVRAKKHLGQHFLNDQNIAERIVESLLREDLPVLEVGPGTGVLTRLLLRGSRPVRFVEIDAEAAAYLSDTFPDIRGRLIQGDFLSLPLRDIFSTPFSIIGNFPYNISSQIFFRVLEHRDLIPEVVCMIQKEVAERIAAPPGSKTYGILSVLLQAYFRIEYLFTVHEHVFSPPPKVKSAVIRLTRDPSIPLPCEETLFRQVVKTGFNQRRKTLSNSLKSLLNGHKPQESIFSKRPEQLSVQEFATLTNLVAGFRACPPTLQPTE